MTETNKTVDLWGEIVAETVRTPLTILKEQGALLERKTKGLLTVQISSQSTDAETFHYIFSIKSAILNYSYTVFSISHQIELYPLTCYSEIFGGRNYKQAEDEEAFLEILKEMFQAPKTQKIISSLLSQSAAV